MVLSVRKALTVRYTEGFTCHGLERQFEALSSDSLSGPLGKWLEHTGKNTITYHLIRYGTEGALADALSINKYR